MKNKFLAFNLCALLSLLFTEVSACTTFIISGRHTPDGRPILYKNRDTDEMQNSLVFFTDGKYRYIGLVDGNSNFTSMVWGGYNETGFAIMNSAAYNNNIGDTTKFSDQEGVLMKLALQTCKTLDDFENLLRNLPKPLGVDANFGVIDASGGAAYYETGNYKFVKFNANDPEVAPDGILIRTNYSHSADITKGFGFARYNTAYATLKKAAEQKNFSAGFLINNISRNLYHSLTKTDLTSDIPLKKESREFRFFIDYIPRLSTASAIMVVGAKDESHAREAVMWTVLGFPLTSVAVPVWISGSNPLPRVVTPDDSLKAPLCSAALKFKEDCFPLTYDRGYNYINLSAVLNKQNDGYMQLLQPVENTIIEKAEQLQRGFERGTRTETDIPAFYKWADRFLSEKYRELFGLTLLE